MDIQFWIFLFDSKNWQFNSGNFYFNSKNNIEFKNRHFDFIYIYLNLKFDIWILKF